MEKKINQSEVKSWKFQDGHWVCHHVNGFIGFGKTKKEAYKRAKNTEMEDFIDEEQYDHPHP